MLSSATLKALVRKGRLAASVVLLLAACGAGKMHASSFTYDIILTPNAGSLYGGTGVLTVATAPSATTVSTYTQASGALQALTFSIDGQSFLLAGASNSLAQFIDGTLTDVTFAEQIGASPNRFTLDTSGVYAFYYNNGQSVSGGTFTASAAPGIAPEPSSLLLLGTGALVGLGAMRRKLLS